MAPPPGPRGFFFHDGQFGGCGGEDGGVVRSIGDDDLRLGEADFDRDRDLDEELFGDGDFDLDLEEPLGDSGRASTFDRPISTTGCRGGPTNASEFLSKKLVKMIGVTGALSVMTFLTSANV